MGGWVCPELFRESSGPIWMKIQNCWENKNVGKSKLLEIKILLSTPSQLSADCGLFISHCNARP